MAPHEWVRTPEGALVKTDNTGHNADHTIIGAQSVLWDIAGAIVEWNLSVRRRELLVRTIEESGWVIDRQTLSFYELAYIAFRLGQTVLCLELEPSDSGERQRLSAAQQSLLVAVRQRVIAREG